MSLLRFAGVTVRAAAGGRLKLDRADDRWSPHDPIEPTVPSGPTNLAVVVAGSDVTVTWAEPVSDGGAAITEYRVFFDGALTDTVPATDPLTVDYLAVADGPHTIGVRAFNGAHLSPMSTVPVSIIPDTGGEAWSTIIYPADIAPVDVVGLDLVAHENADGGFMLVEPTTSQLTAPNGLHYAAYRFTPGAGVSKVSFLVETVPLEPSPATADRLHVDIDGAGPVRWDLPHTLTESEIPGSPFAVTAGVESVVTVHNGESGSGFGRARVVDTLGVVTPDPVGPPDMPQVNVNVAGATVELTWVMPADNGAAVTLTEAHLETRSIISTPGGMTSATWNDVADGSYSWSVAVTNSEGTTTATGSVTVDTSPPDPPPPAPDGLGIPVRGGEYDLSLYTLDIDPNFGDGSHLPATIRTYWQHLWTSINNPASTLNRNPYEVTDQLNQHSTASYDPNQPKQLGSYDWGRKANEYLTALIEGIRVTGDPALLDLLLVFTERLMTALDDHDKVMAETLSKPANPRGYRYVRWGHTGPDPNYLWALGSDGNLLDDVLTTEMMTRISVVFWVNRAHNPRLEEIAVDLFGHVANEWVPKMAWRANNGANLTPLPLETGRTYPEWIANCGPNFPIDVSTAALNTPHSGLHASTENRLNAWANPYYSSKNWRPTLSSNLPTFNSAGYRVTPWIHCQEFSHSIIAHVVILRNVEWFLAQSGHTVTADYVSAAQISLYAREWHDFYWHHTRYQPENDSYRPHLYTSSRPLHSSGLRVVTYLKHNAWCMTWLHYFDGGWGAFKYRNVMRRWANVVYDGRDPYGGKVTDDFDSYWLGYNGGAPGVKDKTGMPSRGTDGTGLNWLNSPIYMLPFRETKAETGRSTDMMDLWAVYWGSGVTGNFAQGISGSHHPLMSVARMHAELPVRQDEWDGSQPIPA